MTEELTPIARALGRMPCGLYVVTTHADREPVGFLGSLVMQVGFDPPTVCVAVGKERGPLEGLRQSGRFALSVIDAESTGLMSPFFKQYADGESPFDELATAETSEGSTVLTDALAWLDCRVVAEQETGDHVVVFGEVTEAHLEREGEPKVHLRKNGLGY